MSICSVRMNCCLIYGTSETLERALMPSQMVNYYLDYRTPETNKALSAGQHGRASGPSSVNYCLIYGISETARVRQAHPNPVNYYLNYGTSETKQ